VTRRLWIIAAVVVALVVAGGAGGLVVLKHRDQAAQRDAAETFARAWRTGNLARISYANGTGPAIAAAAEKITRQLTTAAVDSPADVTVASVTKVNGSTDTVGLHVRWTLSRQRVWSYATSVTLVKTGGRWLPRYAPSVIQPKLTVGSVLRASTEQAPRGQIVGANGDVLVTERPVVVVGLEPSRTTSLQASTSAIASLTGVDGGALLKRAKAAPKDSFVDVITLRKPAYDEIRDQLQPIPGAVFQSTTLALAPTFDFARALIGTVGTATADVIKQSDGRVQVGDLTGLSGLQKTYDQQLSGTPGLVVKAVPASGTTKTSAQNPGQTLFTAQPITGKPVKVSIDRKIQEAAENALKAAKKPAALVAIRPGTGDVLAVANGGPNANGYNRAFLGQYPPGSTFKVASTLGLLGAGVTGQTPVPCPAKITVGGKTFKNAEHEKLGTVDFATDFANSCNTAFVGSSTKISTAALAKAANSLGYGQPNALGVPAFTGQVPTSGDSVAHAAAMIGQGTVLTSPVTVAGATAAVASGKWMPPRLVLSDGTGDSSTASPGSGSTAGPQPAATGVPAAVTLPTGSVTALRQLMREVVTKGTGTGLRSVPGGVVYGKTGTAEFGNDDPPQTHAWFTGYQGDVAFAVVVEDGGFGATAAVPLVKQFLTTLAAG
jgi:cell division protein FtsI/penicillin-binding protein 2